VEGNTSRLRSTACGWVKHWGGRGTKKVGLWGMVGGYRAGGHDPRRPVAKAIKFRTAAPTFRGS